MDSVRGLSTPLNNHVKLDLTDGLLNFQTGNLTGFERRPLVLRGGRNDQHHHVVTGRLGASNTLLTGSFSSAEVNVSSGLFKVVIAAYVNSVDDKLAAFFGIALACLGKGISISLSMRPGDLPVPSEATRSSVATSPRLRFRSPAPC